MPTNVTIHVDNNVIDSDIAMLVLDAMAAVHRAPPPPTTIGMEWGFGRAAAAIGRGGARDAPPAWCDVEGEEGEGGRHPTGPAVQFTGLRQPATGAWSDEGGFVPLSG